MNEVAVFEHELVEAVLFHEHRKSNGSYRAFQVALKTLIAARKRAADLDEQGRLDAAARR